MSRYKNGTRRAWTDDDVAWAVEMADADICPIDIARTLNRTISSVENKLRLIRQGPTLGPGMARYERPEEVACDDDKHLNAISAANGGYGFPAVTEPLLGRLAAFERAIPRRVAA